MKELFNTLSNTSQFLNEKRFVYYKDGEKPSQRGSLDAAKERISANMHKALEDVKRDIKNKERGKTLKTVNLQLLVSSGMQHVKQKVVDPNVWNKNKEKVRFKILKALEKAGANIDKLKTPEYERMENLALKEGKKGLKKLMNNEHVRKLKSFLKENGIPWADAVAFIFAYWKLDHKKGMGKVIAKALDYDPNKKPTPAGNKRQPAPGSEVAASALTGVDKKYTDIITKLYPKLRIQPNTAEIDVKTLEKTYGIKDVPGLLKASLLPGGHLKKIRDALPTAFKGIEVRLTDALFQDDKSKSEKDIKDVITAMNDSKNTIPKTNAGIRAFLTKASTAKNVQSVIDSYK